MSVSFGPSFNEAVAHVITCICGETNFGVVYPDYATAVDAKSNGEFKATCGDIYCDYLYIQPAVAEPECQMSNVNASEMLDLLGIKVGEDFSDRCVGQLSGEDMLGRVLIAQGLNPVDAGKPAMAVGGNPNFIDCGRPEGYYDYKLGLMREVAEWAIANNRTVVWG